MVKRCIISLGLSFAVFIFGCYMAITQPHWVYSPAGWITSLASSFFFLLAGYYVIKIYDGDEKNGDD